MSPSALRPGAQYQAMIVIRHKETGETLLAIDADQLRRRRSGRRDVARAPISRVPTSVALGSGLWTSARPTSGTRSSMEPTCATPTLRWRISPAPVSGAPITDARFQGSNMGRPVPARHRFPGRRSDPRLSQLLESDRAATSPTPDAGSGPHPVDLSGARFVGADLSGANLSYSTFAGRT